MKPPLLTNLCLRLVCKVNFILRFKSMHMIFFFHFEMVSHTCNHGWNTGLPPTSMSASQMLG